MAVDAAASSWDKDDPRARLAQLDASRDKLTEEEYRAKMREVLESCASQDEMIETVSQSTLRLQSAMEQQSAKVSALQGELGDISVILSDKLREDNEVLRKKLTKGSLPARTARVVLPVGAFAGAGYGFSKLFNPISSEFVESLYEAWDETGRLNKVDPRAESACAKYYPGNIGSLTCDRIVSNLLYKRGYTRDNTLFATSTCPDEVNSKPRELTDLMKNRWVRNRPASRQERASCTPAARARSHLLMVCSSACLAGRELCAGRAGRRAVHRPRRLLGVRPSRAQRTRRRTPQAISNARSEPSPSGLADAREAREPAAPRVAWRGRQFLWLAHLGVSICTRRGGASIRACVFVQ